MSFINRFAVGLAVVVALAACGGGGGNPGTSSGSPPTTLATTAPTAGLTVGVGAAQVFSIIGGKSPYQASSSNVQVAVAGVRDNVLTIGGVAAGLSTITVSDADGKTSAVAVTVGNLVALYTSAPDSLTMVKETQASFAVGGGVAPYTAASQDSRIAVVNISGTTMIINAGSVGSTTLFIRDASGGAPKSLNISVAGGAPGTFFTTAPSILKLGAGSTMSYQISGGVQPYFVSSTDARLATGSINGSILTIAALKIGSSTLQILDSAGNALSPIAVTVDGTTGSAGPASIEILPSSNSLSSAAGSKVTFIVTVKDSVNTAIPNQPVTFTASSGTLTGANPAPNTDASGSISTVSLSPGGDFVIRSITVTATAGSASKSISIPVTGTALTISGPGSALVGNPALAYSVKAVDSAGKPIFGAALNLTSTLGNPMAPQSVTTDLAGSATFNYTPNLAGADTLKVSGLGTSATANVAVSNEDFSFVAPASAANLAVNTSTTVTARYKLGGIGVAGQTVTFSTTRGTLGSPTAVTNGSGDASTTVSSTTAGPVTVSAQLGTARTSLAASFVATIPATIVVQANPSAILPNPTGTSANQSTLSATVRDGTGNPVAGRVVNFTASQDGSNGSIVPGSGTTDANGMTSVQFIPGALSTPSNGVVIRASVQQDTSISSTASLTVNGEALFISIGVASTLTVLDTVIYEKDFSVYVTDANGAPATGRPVSLSVYPTSYGKGRLERGATGWGYNVTSPTTCANEDVNRNGIMDSGEDINSDTRLTPGLPVVVTPASVTTDAVGYAAFKLRYGKNYALWLQTEVTARALVGGTESSRVTIFDLPMTTEDAKADGSPANVVSPFGTATVCSDKN